MIQGLIGHWDLNGNAKDRTPFGNDGVVSGATLTTDMLGQANRAYSFDGVDDKIESAFYYDGLPFSLVARYKFNAITNVSPGIIGFTDSAGKRKEMYITSSGAIRLFTWDGTENVYWQTANITASRTGWHTLIGTWDGTTPKIYLDGVERALTKQSGIGAGSANLMRLARNGVTTDNADYWMNGVICDARIYNRALTLAEVTTITKEYNPNYRLNSLAQGLVGHWDMAGNAKDKTPYGNDGVVTGATLTTDRYGQANRAYQFTNGADNKIETNTPASAFQSGFTISAWINPTSAGEATASRIVDKSSGLSGANGLQYVTISNSLLFGIDTINVGSALSSIQYDGVWKFVAVTVSSAGLVTHYLNGAVSGTPANTNLPTAITTANPFTIGNRSVTADRDFDGKISDVRIYNRVLSATEVLNLYKNY